MLRIGSVVWGVKDLPRAIAFWTQVLNYQLRREPEDDWAILVPREGVGVQLALSVVSSAKPRRHHLDLYAEDQAAEVERLLALGAARAEWRYPPGADFVVLTDPDGNNFCVVEVEAMPAWLASVHVRQDETTAEGDEP